MPRPGNRTNKIIKKKKHGKVRYIRKKRKKARCPICNSSLHGIIKKGAKSYKTVNRLFGGQLCSKCVSRVITEYTRIKEGEKNLEEVDVKFQKYVSMLSENR